MVEEPYCTSVSISVCSYMYMYLNIPHRLTVCKLLGTKKKAKFVFIELIILGYDKNIRVC